MQKLNNKEHMNIKVIPYLEVQHQHWVLVFPIQQPYVVNGEQKQCCFFSIVFEECDFFFILNKGAIRLKPGKHWWLYYLPLL